MSKIFGMDERELEQGLARLGPEWSGLDLSPKKSRKTKRTKAKKQTLHLAAHSQNTVTLHIYKVSEGGMGQKDAMYLFKCAGIPCRKATSIYVGQTAVEVPKKFAKRAERILYR